VRTVFSIEDLTDDDVQEVLDRARAAADGSMVQHRDRAPVVALVFLAPSLRTRLGFATAAVRIGGHATAVDGARVDDAMSAAESLHDTLRTASGMADLVVVRTDAALEPHRGACEAPTISGGDADEHPSQAMIDLFALERRGQAVGEQTLAVVGDLQMRSVRSLLRLLRRRPPRRLVLVAPSTRSADPDMLAPLAERVEHRQPGALEDVDVVYLAGLPARRGSDRIDAEGRAAFALGRVDLAGLPTDARVLSPLPLVDELAPDARDDPRVQVFQQSDDGVFVRAALLDLLLR
jgi:aspartate carbamoyltransferase catalytic subunit